jgi:S-adenosylmethionine decarboxylase
MEVSTDKEDYWLDINGVKCAGRHLLIDFYGVKFDKLNAQSEIEDALVGSAIVAGATVLHSYMHAFAPQGVSGVVVLAESHISIHTWPEKGVATLDIFMCGKADPVIATEFLTQHFEPASQRIKTFFRGNGQ